MKTKDCEYCQKTNHNIPESQAQELWNGDKYPFRCVECGLLNYGVT